MNYALEKVVKIAYIYVHGISPKIYFGIPAALALAATGGERPTHLLFEIYG